MSASTGPRPEARPPFRRIVRSALRAVGSTVALVTIYYLLPFDRTSTGGAAAILVLGLVLLVGLVAFQVRSIIRSRFPALRAVEALATSVPLFLLLFAGSYLVLSTISARSFGQSLTHTDALYFTVTVFSTVGFGDITAKTEAARLVVTSHMTADLPIMGLGIRVIFGAVTRSRTRQQPADAGTERPSQAGQ